MFFPFKNKLLYKRISLVTFCIVLTVIVIAQQKRFSFTEPKMGSPFTIVFYSGDSLQANAIAKRCFHLVDSFNLVFSDYIDSSELSRLNASSGKGLNPVQVSPALYEIIALSKKAFYKSDGAFDITIGPLVKLWRQSRKVKQFPSGDSVQSALNQTGFGNLSIDSFHKTVALTKAGMQLDLGGIAKGWIAQKIIDFLHTQQVNHALADAGGDIAMSEAPPGTGGWTIGVNIPETTDELLSKKLFLKNKAVATSGDAYQFMMKDGKKYSHIIDPRTGYGVTSQRNVTVIARDGATADWLATACSILKIKRAKRLATQFDADVLIAEVKNGRMILNATKGFARYWKQP
ncbi:MAG: ApbE family lipoprotein [Ferruginibacter sp.]|nr:ApbE family lipoprotein [Ferruginibacter sp.]